MENTLTMTRKNFLRPQNNSEEKRDSSSFVASVLNKQILKVIITAYVTLLQFSVTVSLVYYHRRERNKEYLYQDSMFINAR